MAPHILPSRTFPVSLKERVAVGNLEFYGMDTYKPTRENDPDLRHARHLEHQRHQSTGAVWPHGRVFSGCFA